MSSLVSLEVRGIRSFGTSQEDGGLINFASPITLIVGQNGCGKTTLIEALKYATTGMVPDNTNKGSGFLHDPKLDDAVETLALVKLKFYDTKGDSIVVSRPMKATQKQKNLSFSSLDPSLKFTKKESKKSESISGRCADIDNLVSSSLGVSRAVLNNVIFCHQEDSSWPLDEGSKVKAKFDAIFEAKKYNTFLDDLRKLRKQYSDKLKIKSNDLNYLKTYQNDAASKRAQLSELMGRLASSRDNLKQLKDKLSPISSKISELNAKEMSMQKLNREYESYKAKLSAVVETMNHIRSGIRSEFSGTDEELANAMNDFQSELQKKEFEVESLEQKIEEINKNQKKNATAISQDQVKLGHLNSDLEKNQSRITMRNSSVIRLTEDLSLDLSVSMTQLNDCQDEVKRVLSLINGALTEKKEDLNLMHQAHEQEISQLQRVQTEIMVEKTKLESTIDNKQQSLSKCKNECQQLKNDIDEVDRSAETLGKLQAKLDRVKKQIDSLDANNNIDEMERKITDTKKERERLEDNLSIISKEVEMMQRISQQKAEIDARRSPLSRKQEDSKRLLNRHQDSLKKLLGTVPEQGIKMSLLSAMDKLADDVRSKTAEINAVEKEITESESEKKHLFDLLRTAKQTFAEYELAVDQACGRKDFEECVSELDTKIQELQDEKGTLSSSDFLYRRYMKKLQTTDPCCPLCSRNFSTEDEVNNLVAELSLKVRDGPSKLRSVKEKLESLEAKRNQLQDLKPKYQKLAVLKNNEIPTLQEKLETLEKKLEKKKDQLSVLQIERSTPQNDEHLAKDILSDIAILDQLNVEIRNLDREITKLESKLPSGSSNKSLKDVLEEQKSAQGKITAARDLIEDLQTKMASIADKRTKLHVEKNSIQDQLLKISGNAQMRAQLSEKLEEAESLVGMLQVEIESTTNELHQVNVKFEQASRNIKSTVSSNKAAYEKAEAKVKALEQRIQDLMKNHELIMEFERSGGAQKVEAVQKSLSSLQRIADELNDELDNVKYKREQAKNLIATQKSRERELDDNVKLREKRKEENALNEKVKEFKVKIGNLDYDGLSRERKKLQNEEEEINREKSHIEGRQRELDNSIQNLENELNQDRLRNADMHYKNKLIEIKVEEAAIEDLAKYYSALDWALNHFHTEKMKIINNTIKDLWRQIYKGNDIDHIAIQTENDVVANVDKRRVFNYQVVQVKNGVKLDMRGRCSAGQKVLACLIIRMALAETFSSNCGVLALDEPTTNLDADNIASLTDALVDIVNARSSQKNFQLVVITHDTTFLEILRRIDKAQYYYKISRNMYGKSRVEKIKMAGADDNYYDEI